MEMLQSIVSHQTSHPLNIKWTKKKNIYWWCKYNSFETIHGLAYSIAIDFNLLNCYTRYHDMYHIVRFLYTARVVSGSNKTTLGNCFIQADIKTKPITIVLMNQQGGSSSNN